MSSHTKKTRAQTSKQTPEARKAARDKRLLPATKSPLYVGDGVWSSVRVNMHDDESKSIEHFEWNRTSLLPYSRFRKLYGERKYAKQPTDGLRLHTFTDLPAELRNQVYRLLLISEPAYIDLSPKTTIMGSNGAARYHHMKRLGREISPKLRLLRTNKQIHEEASAIFYGEHEWRFTSVKGWYVLDSFLRKIGPTNQALLRKLVVHVPWCGRVRDYVKDDLPESARRLGTTRGIIKRMGLQPREWDKAFSQDACVRRTVRILEASGSLEYFRLTIPDTFRLCTSVHYSGIHCPCRYTEPDRFLNSKLFKSLKLQLVRLHGGFVTEEENQDMQRIRDERQDCVNSHYHHYARAKELGWEVVVEPHDENGYYPVALKEGDVIDEAEDRG